MSETAVARGGFASLRTMALRFSLAATLVLLLALLSARRAEARAAELGVPLLPAGSVRHGLAVLSTALAIAVVGQTLAGAVALLLAVPLLLSARSARRGVRVRGQLVPLTPDELAELAGARAGGASLLDATSLRGACMLFAFIALAVAAPDAFELADDPYGVALACAIPCWFSGARLGLMRGYGERGALLLHALAESALQGCALRLLARLDEHGTRSEPRVRIDHPGRYPGLVRVEVLVDSRRERPPFVLCATVGKGSLAERWIARSGAPIARVDATVGARVALLWSSAEFDRGVAALFALLDRESQQTIERMVGVSLQVA